MNKSKKEKLVHQLSIEIVDAATEKLADIFNENGIEFIDEDEQAEIYKEVLKAAAKMLAK